MPLLPGDLAVGDVVLMMYDGTRCWISANPNITANTTFNCANNTDISNLFKALSRKQIQNDVTVTVKLAIANYTPFTTYHNNAARIIVEGTMRTTVPAYADFYKTGSSPAQRAADSANNIAMLRTSYGTEIQFTNTVIGTGQMAVWHTGPGKIRFKDLLVTGAERLCRRRIRYGRRHRLCARQCVRVARLHRLGQRLLWFLDERRQPRLRELLWHRQLDAWASTPIAAAPCSSMRAVVMATTRWAATPS